MFKAGDKIWSENWGQGIVLEINVMSRYPVVVQFEKSPHHIIRFTESGMYDVLGSVKYDICHDNLVSKALRNV